DEGRERGRIPRGIEVAHEARRRRAHDGEHAFERAPEEVDTAVGQARREERDDLTVGRVRIAERILDRVAVETRGVVEVAIETLEWLAQSLRGANGSGARLDWHPA